MTDAALAAAFEATWPPAEVAQAGGFIVGRGQGGGGRVSSARAIDGWAAADIPAAVALHRGWAQRPLFRAMDDDAALIAVLTDTGFTRENPTAIMTAPTDLLTGQPIPPVTTFAVWPPMAIQRDIWAAGNIGSARQTVMNRVTGPKTAILGRVQDRAAGAAFVAIHDDVAMVHAVEVVPDLRRHGLAVWMMRQAAIWAKENRAERLALAVSRANVPAVALYRALGFTETGGYAYYGTE